MPLVARTTFSLSKMLVYSITVFWSSSRLEGGLKLKWSTMYLMKMVLSSSTISFTLAMFSSQTGKLVFLLIVYTTCQAEPVHHPLEALLAGDLLRDHLKP